jgi:hypothetical protein
MATLRTVLDGLVAQLSPLYTGASPAVQLAVGWPPLDVIQDVSKGDLTAISVYDGDGTRNTTRWAGKTWARVDTVTAPGISVTVNPSLLPPGGSCTVTLSGTPATNDAVVFAAQPLLGPAVLGSAVASSGETLDQLATALASSLTTAGLTATAVGAVVTVTAAGGPSYTVQAETGNLGARTFETVRIERHVRVIIWTQTELLRQSIGDPAVATICALEDYFGYSLAPNDVGLSGVTVPGDWVRVKYGSDRYVEDEQLKDVYRRDIRLSLEYGTPLVQTLYPVLGLGLTVTP